MTRCQIGSDNLVCSRGHLIGATRTHDLQEAILVNQGAPADHSKILARRTDWIQSVWLISVGRAHRWIIMTPNGSSFCSIRYGWPSHSSRKSFSCYAETTKKYGAPKWLFADCHDLLCLIWAHPPSPLLLLPHRSQYCHCLRCQKSTWGRRWVRSSKRSRTEFWATIPLRTLTAT